MNTQKKNNNVSAVEQRKSPRVATNIQARVLLGDSLLAKCIVKDISVSGARLMIPRFQWVPKEFNLKDVVENTDISAEQVWSYGEEVGVRFVRFSSVI